MILGLVALATLLLSAVFTGWQHIRMRRCRWALYALRDELRGKAISDPRFRSELFWETDYLLTWLCHDIHSVSTREFLDALLGDDPLDESRFLGEDPDVAAYIRNVHARAIRDVSFLLAYRHAPVVFLFALTGVGLLALLWVQKRVKKLPADRLFEIPAKREAAAA